MTEKKSNSYRDRMSGVYEINADGIVLYSSVKLEDGSVTRAYELDGADFFRKVVEFNNANDFHHRFQRFREARIPSEAFEFTCKYQDEHRIIIVLLARLNKDQESESFLIHIRQQSRNQW